MRFEEFSPAQVTSFQRNILKTILRLETTFFELAEEDKGKNVLVVCDRGTMDPSACECCVCRAVYASSSYFVVGEFIV